MSTDAKGLTREALVRLKRYLHGYRSNAHRDAMSARCAGDELREVVSQVAESAYDRAVRLIEDEIRRLS